MRLECLAYWHKFEPNENVIQGFIESCSALTARE
jgi:hypothetical protein